LEANIVAVTLRQSEQWQTWVLTKSSPSTGCFFVEISHSAIRRPRFASIQRWKELTISS
jgi:hypothetical protein